MQHTYLTILNATTLNDSYHVHFFSDSPVITTGDTVTVTLYASSEITCEADANPKPDNFVTWIREGFDMSRFTKEYTEGKAVLKMPNVSLADAGLYTCQASNGIEPVAKKDIQVVVHCKLHWSY